MKLPKRRFLLPAFCLLIAMAVFLAAPVEGPAVTRAESFVTLATYDGVITPSPPNTSTMRSCLLRKVALRP